MERNLIFLDFSIFLPGIFLEMKEIFFGPIFERNLLFLEMMSILSLGTYLKTKHLHKNKRFVLGPILKENCYFLGYLFYIMTIFLEKIAFFWRHIFGKTLISLGIYVKKAIFLEIKSFLWDLFSRETSFLEISVFSLRT